MTKAQSVIKYQKKIDIPKSRSGIDIPDLIGTTPAGVRLIYERSLQAP